MLRGAVDAGGGLIDFLAAPAGKSQDFYRGWHGQFIGNEGSPLLDNAEFRRGWDAREAAYERYQDRYHGGWPETDR